MKGLLYFITFAVLLSFVFLNCHETTSGPSSSHPLPARTFRMGFSGIPPKADIGVLLQSIDLWSLRADAAIMSYEVPWDSLLDGVPIERLVTRDLLGLANYYRGKGHQLWLYIDPANGLNRSADADALVRRGRSFTESSIQQLYERWAFVSDSIVRPEHLGLALETNLIRASSPPALYVAIRQGVNQAAEEIRAIDTTVRMSISIQVDAAWGALDGGGYQGVDTDFVHFPFIQELGLSSYPYLAGFTEPEDIPLNYYSRLLEGHGVPAMVTEGGWTSDSIGNIASTPGKQRRYIVRQMALLDSVRAIAVFQLTFTDLDLSGISLPPGSILPLFAHLGLVDIHLRPKPALGAWDSTYIRPR